MIIFKKIYTQFYKKIYNQIVHNKVTMITHKDSVKIKRKVNLVLLSNTLLYFLSKVVAFIHLSYVLFVFLGFFYILLGALLRHKLIRNPVFRIIHLIAMTIVAIQQYYMINCPLTILEKKLLIQAGRDTYSGAFVAHLMDQYQLNIPTSYYLPLYITLSILFLLSFILIPPRFRKQKTPRFY